MLVTSSIIVGLWSAPVSAHGDVHARIDALSSEIEERPEDPGLLSSRGALFVLDEDWTGAADDFERAWALDRGSDVVERQLANVLLHTGEPDVAAWLAQDVARRSPEDAEAHQLRARALSLLGDPDGAVLAFGRAIELERHPSPRLYLERAESELARGAGHEEAAVSGLVEGMAELGPIVTLVERAVAIESARGGHGRALELVDSLPDAARHAPDKRLMRARLLRELGRLDHAGIELREARAAIDALPPSRKDSSAMVALGRDVDRELDSLRALGDERLRDRRILWIGGALVLAAAMRISWATIRGAWLRGEGRVRAGR